MKTGNKIAAICFALFGGMSGHAAAQGIPNYGNFNSLNADFRVGVSVVNTGPIAINVQNSFQQNEITDIQEFLDPSQIALVIGNFQAQQAAISEVFDLRGAFVLAGYAQNSTTLTVNVVDGNGNVINGSNGQPCAFTFNGTSRQASYNSFDAVTDLDVNAGDPRTQALFQCLYTNFARSSPLDPLAGNPSSLQARLVRNAMDLSVGDSLIEQGDDGDANAAGDPWIVGAAYTNGSAGRFDYDRFDARIQRSFRIMEGNRAQLKFDLPFQYTTLGNTESYSAQLGVGLEIPVAARRWSLEPRVSYGIVYSGDYGSAGHILQASVTSRTVFDGIGRGRFIVGNMIGYSTTLSAPGVAVTLNPDLQNISLRNGVAYEMPLRGAIAGRSVSMRASYTHTQFFGDDLRNNNFHELTLSFGLRGREESIRASRDLVRINANATLARGYKSFTAGVGFRF